MRPVTVHTVISAPREEIFDFVADLSLRPAFCDHFLEEYRLARANPRGEGAAARFRIDLPFADEWAEVTVTTCDRPRKIVEEGRIGRVGRSRLVSVYELVPEGSGTTRIELTIYFEAGAFVDRFKQVLAAGRVRRKSKRALERLRRILEEGPQGELPRARVAGYEPTKAPRFGDHIPTGRSVAPADR